MKDVILNFNKQFVWKPVIENQNKLKICHRFIVIGMGGSHLEADLILNWDPKQHIMIRSTYALPQMHKGELDDYLVIVSSYSGNTEEVVDGLQEAINRKLNVAVISTGGKLLKIAKENSLSYIKLPDTGIQPRSALGYSTKAFLKVIGLQKGLDELTELADKINPAGLEVAGQRLAQKLQNKIPIIYASDRNRAIAYNWKIKFNETGKIPAFYNVFPELNHNEMAAYGGQRNRETEKHPPSPRLWRAGRNQEGFSDIFYFIFLEDSDDHPRIVKRMKVTKKMFEKKGLPVEIVELDGKKGFERIFRSLILADWTAYYTAKLYDLEPEQVPMIEEFKKLISYGQ